MHRALLSVLLAVSLVTGCSGDGDDTEDTTNRSTTPNTSARRSSTSASSTVPSTPPTTSGGIEPVRRAVTLCESLAAGDPARATVLSAAPSVAGAVAAELAAAGAPPDPWNALPVDQFVAVCAFAAAPATAEQPPPTIACPDGAIVLDVEVEAVYADEHGRVSDASEVHETDPCVEPPPLP